MSVKTEHYPQLVATEFPPLGNTELPIHEHKDRIIEAFNNHSAIVIVSPTGTGKSTQTPQYALEAGFKSITQTQPRRRPAENVMERIKTELSGPLGDQEAAELISFQTGAGLVGPRNARIKIMTDGLLAVKDAYEKTDGDDEMWIIDEIHEGNQNQWLLLGLAKQKILANPDFTVVAMTATADKYKVISYLTNEYGEEPAVIELEAIMHEVHERVEPHSNTIKETIKAALDVAEHPDDHDGSNTIILFESGKREIKDTMDELTRRLPPDVLAKTTILGGHAKMPSKLLAPIYEDVDGIKIVVQTNMGKTSMTIPRTRYVITQGLERQTDLDDEDVSQLLEVPISQDCMAQQRGRAGRTSTGIFVHTKRDGEAFIPLEEREAHLQPEIVRSNIDRVVLYLAARGENILEFDGIDEIPAANMARAMQRMQALGALDDFGSITDKGRKMVKYPTSPENAACMVASEDYPALIRTYMAAMIAATEVGGIKIYEHGRTTNWRTLSAETSSDILAQLDTLVAVYGKKFKEMDKLDIDINNFIRADELYRKIARRAGVDQVPELVPPTAAEREVLRECVLAGYVNSVYLPTGEKLFKKIGESLKLREISNRSVVSEFSKSALIARPRNVEAYVKGRKETKPILEDVTEVSVAMLGRLATHLTEWVHSGYKLRGGTFVAAEKQMLGVRTVDFREVPAKPSPQLRAAVIEHVKVNPGKHLVSLYLIKKEIERLSHKAKRPNPMTKLTEDAISDYIERATPAHVTDPSHVEENLRQIIAEEGIRLSKYVSPEEHASILKNAPDVVQAGHEVNELLKKLHYRMESPTIITTDRTRTNYGAIKTTKKHEPNMLHKALSEAESNHLSGEPLMLRANRIVDSTKDDYRKLGTELALVLDGGPAADVLEEQRENLMSASRGLNFAKRLPPSDEPDPVLHLPFMCAPFAGPAQRDQFIELMSTELPVHGIVLSSIEWTLKTRLPQKT